MADGNPWRLFAGAFPPDSVLDVIERDVSKWRAQLSKLDAKWVAREQMHATLYFLGNVSTEVVPALVSKLRMQIESQHPLLLDVQGIDCFPSCRRPRVIWAGLKGELKELLHLQARVSLVCAKFTEKPDGKPFSAHITLARVKALKRQEVTAISSIIEQEAPRRFGSWKLDEICLVRSEIGSMGSKYSIVERFELRGAQ